MSKPAHVDLTRRESQIMAILYRRRRATVEDIRAELPDAPSPSSVRKLLEISGALEEFGAAKASAASTS